MLTSRPAFDGGVAGAIITGCTGFFCACNFGERNTELFGPGAFGQVGLKLVRVYPKTRDTEQLKTLQIRWQLRQLVRVDGSVR